MLATVKTFALAGVSARAVTVEVDVRKGLPALAIVGLPDRAVRESAQRVRAAIANSGFEFPLKRITVNLAPADLRKAGPGSTSRSPRRSSSLPSSSRPTRSQPARSQGSSPSTAPCGRRPAPCRWPRRRLGSA